MVNYRSSETVLRALNITADKWIGNYTANFKMMRGLTTMALLRPPFVDPSKVIFQTDVDEFPDRAELFVALSQIRSGGCNAIR
jgi:hypothetical protein